MKKLAQCLNFAICFMIVKIFMDILNRSLISFKILDLKYRNVGLNISAPESISFEAYRVLSFITAIPLVYLLFQLNTFRKVAKNLERNSVFDTKSGSSLNSVANGLFYFILSAGIIKFFLEGYCQYIISEPNQRLLVRLGESMGFGIIQTLIYISPIAVVAIFVKIIAILVSEGALIKSENDLTI
tara:strand:+ start:109 stop:663 length:555 start_codon:yes stop_codon:yes gene_type:complete